MKKEKVLLTIFLFLILGNQIFSQKIFVPKGAVWKYLDNGSNQSTAWQTIDFNDSSWASGPAQLGYNEGDEATLVSYGPNSSNKYITTYFRHSFDISDSSKLFSLLVKLLRDDGAVVYLNGREIVRSNMPSGTIYYTTKAASGVAGSGEDTFYEFYIEPSILRKGKNVVAVEVHQISGSSSDISFDFELSAATTLPFITRKAPYLIYNGINTQYKIMWQLRRTKDCRLEWGTNYFYSDGKITTFEYGTDHQHTYTFTNLTPDTKYYYKVIIDSLEYKGSFNTAPDENIDSLKFLVYGDNRSYPANHDKVAKQIINLFKTDPEYQSLIMNVGDMVGSGDSEEDWDNQFFDPKYENIQELLSSMGIQAARGNHEGSGTLFKKYFPYPHISKFYWSFDYGPAHFTIIDQYTSYSVGSAQYNWLKNDLEITNKKWKFIILHAPGWSAGGHGNSSNVQNIIQPLCKDNNVQIVFGGHNHYYARAKVDGIMHITTGGGGAPLYSADPNYPNIVKVSATNHFCRISLKGNELDFKAINSSGNTIDNFSIILTKVKNNKSNEFLSEFKLEQNYPNPFNPSTVIHYSIPTNISGNISSRQLVTLIVYDILGRKVATLVNENQKSGNYEVQFNATNLPSGIYYYRLNSGEYSNTRKMILIK